MVNGITCASASPLIFEYGTPPSVSSLSPEAGSLSGQTSVVIQGSGFTSWSSSSTSFCQFGDLSSPALVLSDTEVSCLSPQARDAGLVEVSVYVNGEDKSVGSLSFRYMDPIVVVGASPDYGSTAGGSAVLVYGVGFVPMTNIACVFGDESSAGRYFNSTVVECTSPASSESGAVSLKLSMGGFESEASALSFTYITPASVSEISPVFGSTGGDTDVVVTGSGFGATDEIYCLFGDSESAALYVSESEIVCKSVAHAVGSVDVSVMVNGITSSHESALVYQFISQLLPTSNSISTGANASIYSYSESIFRVIDPSSASTSGNELIKVYGGPFEMDASYYCAFTGSDAVASAAEVWSDGLLLCFTPPIVPPTPLTGTVLVYGGHHYTSFSFPFSFTPPPVISSVTLHPEGLWVTVSTLVLAEPLLNGGSSKWSCVYERSERSYRALVTSPTTLLCGVPHSEVVTDKPSSIYIISTDRIVSSEPFFFDLSGTESQQLLSLDYLVYNTQDVSDTFERVKSANNGSFSTLEDSQRKRSVDRVVWMRQKDSTPPRLPSSSTRSSDEYCFDGSCNYSINTVRPPTPSSTDCLINAQYSCFTDIDLGNSSTETLYLDTDTLYADEGYYYAEESMAAYASDSNVAFEASEVLFLEAVEPKVLHTRNSTWVVIHGRTFSNHTRCVVDTGVTGPGASTINATEETTSLSLLLPSMYISPNAMKCLLPPLHELPAAQRDYLVELRLEQPVLGYSDINSSSYVYSMVSSINTASLLYDDFSTKNFKAFSNVAVLTQGGSSGEEWTVGGMAIREEVCVSPSGCQWEDVPLDRAQSECADKPWFAFMDSSSEFHGTEGLSYCGSVNTSNAHTLQRRLVQEHIENHTKWWHADSLSAVDYNATVPGSIPTSDTKIVYVYPNIASTKSSFEQNLYYYTFALDDHRKWCLRVQNKVTDCLPISSTNLICPLPSSMYREKDTRADLLLDCKTTFFTSELEVTPPVQSEPNDNSSTISLRSWVNTAMPKVHSVKPFGGSIAGGTEVTVEGSYLSGVGYCTFKSTDVDTIYHTVPAVQASVSPDGYDVLTCMTPSVLVAGRWSIDVTMSMSAHTVDSEYTSTYTSTNTLPTGFGYDFYVTPVVSFFSFDEEPTSAHVDDQGAVIVFGQRLPVKYRSFCRASFTDGPPLISHGMAVSSTQMKCPYLKRHDMNRRTLLSIAVSFNGHDYLPIPYLNPLSWSTNDLDVLYSSPYEPELGGMGAVEAASGSGSGSGSGSDGELVPPLTAEPKTLSLLCDHSIMVPVHLMDFGSHSKNYSCYLAGTYGGQANYVSETMLVCSFGRSSPGRYEVVVVDEVNPATRVVPHALVVQCLRRPSLRNAILMQRSEDDGASRLLVGGINFDTNMQIMATISGQGRGVASAIHSRNEMSFLFDTLKPGFKDLSFTLNGQLLLHYDLCLSSEMIATGGKIQNSVLEECTDTLVPPDPYVESAYLTNRTYAIRSSLPKSGLTRGGTAIEIRADSLDFHSQVTCHFAHTGGGSSTVDGVVINVDRVLCYTPPLSPQNTSLTLTNSQGDEWSGAWFQYYPILQLKSVSPDTVDARGGTIVTLHVQRDLSFAVNAFCHLNSVIVPAYFLDSKHVSCSVPALSLSSVNISLGSEYEAWSDSMPIYTLGYEAGNGRIVPSQGTHKGGTAINITVPDFFALSHVKCLFGDSVESSPTTYDGSGYVVCVTPSHQEGKVVVSLTNADLADVSEITAMPSVYAGTYTFTLPATASTISPTSITQGQELDVLVLGTFFRDSPLLSCVLGGAADGTDSFVIPARWLSPTSLSCLVPSEYTLQDTVATQYQDDNFNVSDGSALHQATIKVRVSNNGGSDLSPTSTYLLFNVRSKITDIGPVTGLVTGLTEVSISFQKEFHRRVSCRFGTNGKVIAYQIDAHTMVCVSPTSPSGPVVLQVVDEQSGFILASADFEYVSVPILNDNDDNDARMESDESVGRTHTSTSSLIAAIAGHFNNVTFTGSGFHPLIVGRLRTVSNEVIANVSCGAVSVSSMMCGWRPDGRDEYLFVDISANGQDYLSNFATLQVFRPSRIVSLDPLYASMQGGNTLGFTVDSFNSGYVTSCRFTIVDGGVVQVGFKRNVTTQYVTVPAEILSDTSAHCVTPSFPLRAIAYLSIEQHRARIHGPAEIVIQTVPVARRIYPDAFISGIARSVHILFENPVYRYPSKTCIVLEQAYKLRMLNSTMGTCVVQPMLSGMHSLQLGYAEDTHLTHPLGSVSVTDSLTDITLSEEVILGFKESNVTLSSAGCRVPLDSYCHSITATIQTVAVSNCSITCKVASVPMHHGTIGSTTLAGAPHIELDICFKEVQCALPLYSTTVAVLPAMSIAGVLPATGSTHGGYVVALSGSGFVNDASLTCTFGDLPSPIPATFISSTRLLCTAPPSMPQDCDIQIHRRGLLIATSIIPFKFIPPMSAVTVSPKILSSLGGTNVTVHTQSLHSLGPYMCRFDDKFVPAVVTEVPRAPSYPTPAFSVHSSNHDDIVDAPSSEFGWTGPQWDPLQVRSVLSEKRVSCASPASDDQVLSFAITIDGVDVSQVLDLEVHTAPVVLIVDHVSVPSHQAVNFSVLMDESGGMDGMGGMGGMVGMGGMGETEGNYSVYNDIVCAVDGIERKAVVPQAAFASFVCMVEGDASLLLEPGPHVLTLSLRSGLDAFYTYDFIARTAFRVQKVTPLLVTASRQIAITLTVTQSNTGSEYASCCFGEQIRRAAVLTGVTNEWLCYSPFVPLTKNDDPLIVPIGLARKDGFCEFSGFDFKFVPPRYILSVFPLTGPASGGTTVQFKYEKPVASKTMYCRFGMGGSVGQLLHNGTTLLCLTHTAPVGIIDIQTSYNGNDFESTGYQFEFLRINASNVVPTNTSSVYTQTDRQMTQVRGQTVNDPARYRRMLSERRYLQVIPVSAPQTAATSAGSGPIITTIDPTKVPSSGAGIIDVTGTGFTQGARCRLEVPDPADSTGSTFLILDLSTTFISDTELTCVMPIFSPGTYSMNVRNIDFEVSTTVNIDFVPDPSIYTNYPPFPAFGSMSSTTSIFVYGIGLDLLDGIICRIGNDDSQASTPLPNSVVCSVPVSSVGAGKVRVQLLTAMYEPLAGLTYFEYIRDPIIYDIKPTYGTTGTGVVMNGIGFARLPRATCYFGSYPGATAVLSNGQVLCTVPEMPIDNYAVTLQTNGQYPLQSGATFSYEELSTLVSLYPLNAPALRGNTLVSITGTRFKETVDLSCVFDSHIVPAMSVDIINTPNTIKCRAPSHRPGRVKVSVIADGSVIHSAADQLDFLFTADVSVDKITPNNGYTSGDFPILVFGSNFFNTSVLGCRFGDMRSRGIYLSNTTLICLSPSPLGRPEFKGLSSVPVEVTVNGADYSTSRIPFTYREPCDAGFFCAGMGRALCPNGTFCPVNSNNFTICTPGTFQPREGQTGCVICPTGYICPDHGMARPIVCPAGFICDVMGLRYSAKLCRRGHYCLNGTKSDSLEEFNSSSWMEDYVTGVFSFNDSTYDWRYRDWPAPAKGQSRPLHPPTKLCDGLVCSGGSSAVLAEAPFPCPIGHYCRAGAGTQIPMPKNFSSPQRCFDGFFCPRGSYSPEGKGACPNRFFCPTQVDALPCPEGHYCPGVGNTGPVECYPGTYNPLKEQASCTICPTGHICPGWGLLLPEMCPKGFVCIGLGLSYPILVCPAGYYCNEGTLTLDPSASTNQKPQPCNPGTFCLGGVYSTDVFDWIATQPFGVGFAQGCSEGTFCQKASYLTSGDGQCYRGHYCKPRESFPKKTPRGNRALNLGSVAPTLCYPGTYAPLESQVLCDVCPSGSTCISYGTYSPAICGKGTYRMQVDSVSCTACPTGTYSYAYGAVDITQCYPCPGGRICAIKSMVTLASTVDCSAGYICGKGTDRSSQFAHLAPAGFHTDYSISPEQQYASICAPGYYCNRGTPTYAQLGGKCPSGWFCPKGTAQATALDTQCPRLTTSLGGIDTLQGCRIDDIDVCDKKRVVPTFPFQDQAYIEEFNYDLLDDSGLSLNYVSNTLSTSPTGEVQVVSRIYSMNESSSTKFWVNDTIEVFRSCPQYGSGDGGEKIVLVGRNFRDTKMNYCKFRTCYSANNGQHPRRCKNQIVEQRDQSALPVAGTHDDATYITRGRYISNTRIECDVPQFLFDLEFINQPELDTQNYICDYINMNVVGDKINATGNLSYVRECASCDTCINKVPDQYTENRFPAKYSDGLCLEWFASLSLPCSIIDIDSGVCPDNPELEYMLNPCMSAEVMIEVTNDGVHYSGGQDLTSKVAGTSILSTVRYNDEKPLYNQFENQTIPTTFAVYTYVYPEYWYKRSIEPITAMEKKYCMLPKYSEEAERDREKGWYRLSSNEAAHVQMNFAHIPDDMVYDQHYKIALYIIPSRCNSEWCNEARVRQSPAEYVPCRKPKELSYWFQQTETEVDGEVVSIPKNVLNNLTVYALDDLLFKVEVQLLNGLFAAYEPLFKNTTTVRLQGPSRTRVNTGLPFTKNYKTRTLSKYVSFEEMLIPMQFFFCAVLTKEDTTMISQPLNMPPLYAAYERGRALIMNNVSIESARVPLVLDRLIDINKGTNFWNMPASTPDESKELLDAYFETFHDTSYENKVYILDFQTLVIPYLPYFSNCNTFDSYIPIWMLLEGKECELPVGETFGSEYATDWPRYKFDPLPDQDDIKFVGPFDFFSAPIADWCDRSIQCNYEENLDGRDNTPRWYESASGTSLFSLIRTPINYFEYTGRSGTAVSEEDAGGGAVFNLLLEETSDNFIPIVYDHSEGDVISACVYNCMARSYEFEIRYFQESGYDKRIISATLMGFDYDLDTTNTAYELLTSFKPLDFLQLIIAFAFPPSIFMLIFVMLGFASVTTAFVGWFLCRLTTNLQNPPPIKVTPMLALTLPPALAGVSMAMLLIWLLLLFGNYVIYGYTLFDSNPFSAIQTHEAATTQVEGKYPPEGYEEDEVALWMDTYPSEYALLDFRLGINQLVSGEDPPEPTSILVEDVETARIGRIGSVFFIIAWLCFITSSKLFFPKAETKREREIAKKRTDYAEKDDLWDPVLWKKSNFMFTSFVFSLILVLIVEFSFWSDFGDEIYTIIVALIIMGEILKVVVEGQLQDSILVAPIMASWEFVSQLVTFGSPDFYSFLLSYFLGVAISMFSRVYQSFYLDNIFGAIGWIMHKLYVGAKSLVPRYMLGGAPAAEKAKTEDADAEKDFRKREVEGVAEVGEDSESVEPILDYYCGTCSDTMILLYFPFFVYLLMQYRNELQIPELYGIKESDMVIYLYFQVFMLFAEPVSDVFNHSQNELFAGWKIYEYLVYSRYRFLQRECRWKGLENSLDECIDEKFRRLDQMCFSSQYYLMLTCQTNGIIFLVLAFEVWLRIQYSPFTDAGFFPLVAWLTLCYVMLEWVVMKAVLYLKVWKIKHENTAWHLIQKDRDELDLPGWEEVKGASTEAFIMNQRITSETFRYKFLNYNRTWLIHQLPQLLTPRTMRRSRPYLINQFARIINARRDDISDDSDKDKAQRFGPVVLTAPSRNIIRWWLGKARRRIKLRGIVEPLIKRARGANCEQCLSRKQLQIEYEVDIDKMGDMYDNAYPGDDEVDQVQWKNFWVNNQRYHTVCLACLTKRKEVETKEKLRGGAFDPSVFDDEQEDYPEWGPVFLTAASKAILLNWYRKAQRLRAGKKGKRRDKVAKAISDDEGDDVPVSWLNELSKITPATKGIAIKWMRTARARLQQKRGKGVSTRETDLEDALDLIPGTTESYRSGRKSAAIKK